MGRPFPPSTLGPRTPLLITAGLSLGFLLSMYVLLAFPFTRAACTPYATPCAGAVLAVLGAIGGLLLGMLAVGVATTVFGTWGIIATVLASSYGVWGYLGPVPLALLLLEIFFVAGLLLVWSGLSQRLLPSPDAVPQRTRTL